jgi:hypothetical protein
MDIGSKIKTWVLVSKDPANKRNWLVQCDCGCEQVRSVRETRLKDGQVTGCDASRKPKTGERFGDWIIVSDDVIDGRFMLCRCLGCSKQTERKVNFSTLKNGTSTNCGCKRKETLQNLTDERKQATLAKYEATCFRRYGVNNAAKSKVIKQKIKNITIEKYGVENISHLQETKDKIIAAHMALGGTSCYLQSEKGREKSKATSQKHYGTDHPMQNPELRKKRDDTTEVTHGVRNPMQSIRIRKKQTDAVMAKYGVGNVSQVPEIKQKKLESLHEVWKDSQWRSKAEMDIQQWLLSLGVVTTHAAIDGKEIDIFSEKHKVGIEYNGMYFHSAEKKGKKYHLEKTETAEAQGVRLIHIWEHWWRDRQPQVKNFLRSVFGLNNVVYARKTEIRVIDNYVAWNFIVHHHIQLPKKSTRLALGVFFQERLIAVATFSNHHRKGDLEIVLDRFCCDEETNIVGGLSKLSKFAARHFQQPIFTWADRCISQGNGYLKAGWVLVDTLSVDYFYWDPKQQVAISKQSRQKKTVNTPLGMTEAEHAQLDGLYVMYDCGKQKYRFDG